MSQELLDIVGDYSLHTISEDIAKTINQLTILPKVTRLKVLQVGATTTLDDF